MLDAVGSHFIKYICKLGYDKILFSLGNNLHDFLANIDFVHLHLNHVFIGMQNPSFRITHSEEGTMRLFYHSDRKGLDSFVKGLITAASQLIFRTEVIVNRLPMGKDGAIQYEIINKSIDLNSEAFEKIKTPIVSSYLSTSLSHLLFSVETLCESLPFHFVFKRNFRIVQIGNKLKRFINQDLLQFNGKIVFSDLFIISRPIIDLDFEMILNFSNHLFNLTGRDKYVRQIDRQKRRNSYRLNSTTSSQTLEPIKLKLRGQMISLPVYDSILFVGYPEIDHLEQMLDLDLTIDDLTENAARFYVTRALSEDDHEIIKKIEIAVNHLKIIKKKLR